MSDMFKGTTASGSSCGHAWISCSRGFTKTSFTNIRYKEMLTYSGKQSYISRNWKKNAQFQQLISGLAVW